MNRISVNCLLLGVLLSQSLKAQSPLVSTAEATVTVGATVIAEDTNRTLVGPEEKPDGFAIYQGCSRSVTKVATFGKIHEVLEAANKLIASPSRSITQIATGNLAQADSLAQSGRSNLKTKNCYVYTKRISRCGNLWTLRLKTLTPEEAHAYTTELKAQQVSAIVIYDLE